MTTRNVTKLTDNKFLNIFAVTDPAIHANGYQYAERRGVDSVAFVCYDANQGKFLINDECTPPTGEFLLRAFGGSFDKDKTPEAIVMDEVKEECGYLVDSEKVYGLGKAFVSTQMNQYCHLFMVDITGLEATHREPENAMEAMAQTKWLTWEQIQGTFDWKSVVIITRAAREGLIFPSHMGLADKK